MEVVVLGRTDARQLALRAFGGLVSGGPAVVPVVAFWGCWVGAGSVLAMGFAGWRGTVEGEGKVGNTRAAGAIHTLGGPAPTCIR